MSEVLINDVDLFGYGWVLGQDGDISTTGKAAALAKSHTSAPSLSDALVNLLGQLGQTWSGEPAQASSRTLAFSGFVTGTSLADWQAKVDSMKALLYNGAVRVRFGDRLTQEFRDVRTQEFSANPRAAVLANLAGDVSFSLQFADPLRYDVTAQYVALSAARSALPCGTGPTFPLIKINNAGAAPGAQVITINLRNFAGDVVQTMVFTATLGVGDFIEVDCARTQVNKMIGGVLSDGGSLWTSGEFLVVRPGDASIDALKYATIEVTATAGTVYGQITYCRAWL